MMATLALATLMALPPRSSWFGADKAKHFLVAAFTHSVAFSAARAASLSRSGAQGIGGVSVIAVGVWKELSDRRAGRPFSAGDLVWDAAGGLAAAGLMNGTR